LSQETGDENSKKARAKGFSLITGIAVLARLWIKKENREKSSFLSETER
jgi:hypothetical protein